VDVLEEKAELILASGFAGEVDRMNFSQKRHRFENLLMLNPKVKTNTLHISLNFDAAEKLDDETLQQIAVTYMDKIGFGDQPYLAYRHNDAGHDHIHLVTSNIQASGERIDLHNIGAVRSEKARKEIELEYKLVKAESEKFKPEPGIKAVDFERVRYGKLSTKRAISNTVISSYRFTSMAELNAVLRLFNVTADRGAEDSLMFQKNGLIYSLLDEQGNKKGVPIKSSSLYSKPTLPELEKQFLEHEKNRGIHFTKMLGKLVQREVDDLPVLTLAGGDKKTAPYPAQDKRSQVREQVPKEAFTGAGILNNSIIKRGTMIDATILLIYLSGYPKLIFTRFRHKHSSHFHTMF
jgi:hypothetical protein